MASYRIRVAQDKAEFVQSLVEGGDYTAPFQTFADVLAFASVFGSRRGKRLPLKEIAKTEPAPIALEVFISRGYEPLIQLLAIASSADVTLLSPYEPEAQTQRIKIFEEYANGGLEQLKEELKGSVDYTESLLLILSQERFQEQKPPQDFDLSRFL